MNELQWTKIEDGLPEEGMEVWVYRGNEHLEIDTIIEDRDEKMWGSNLREVSMSDVTHWMPLFIPEPPKEENGVVNQ